MKLYISSSFEVDTSVNNDNPPLSEIGIQQAKSKRITFPDIKFDYCFTSPLIQDYGSAMLLVGDKVLIDRDKRLQYEASLADNNTRIIEFIDFLEQAYPEKTILLVVNSAMNSILQNYKTKNLEII